MDPDVIGRIAERKIQEAIEEGKFDNLPGKGKPLVFDDDPMTPPHLRLANRVLKNANVLPDWMQVHKDIATERKEIAALRARLLRDHAKLYDKLTGLPAEHFSVLQFAVWHAKCREAYLRRLKSLNSSILKLSLLAPSTVQPIAPVKTQEEMDAFDADFPPLPQQPGIEVTPDDGQDSQIKARTRERYRNLR